MLSKLKIIFLVSGISTVLGVGTYIAMSYPKEEKIDDETKVQEVDQKTIELEKREKN